MEVVAISSATSILVAVIAAIATWLSLRARAKTERADTLTTASENLRRGLMERIDQQDKQIAAQDAEIARLKRRIEDLERENLQLYRGYRRSDGDVTG